MSAIQLTIRPNSRLDRIKVVSGIAKYVCLAVLIFSVGFFFFWTGRHFSGFGMRPVLMTLFQCVVWTWYWKLAGVFRFYERGMIFAAETIRSIKSVGILCIIGWVLGTIESQFVKHVLVGPVLTAPPPGAHVVSQTTHTFFMGFFAFDFGTGINFGPFFIGIIIILVAWIMDEGRKIQEEQELTV